MRFSDDPSFKTDFMEFWTGKIGDYMDCIKAKNLFDGKIIGGAQYYQWRFYIRER